MDNILIMCLSKLKFDVFFSFFFSSTTSNATTTEATNTNNTNSNTNQIVVANNIRQQEISNNKNDNPKVIVEHKPLPSIYDLHQMSAACDNLEDATGDATMLKESRNLHHHNPVNNNNVNVNDSGLSDDEEEDEDCDEVSDLETGGEDSEEEEVEDEDENEPSSSPIFDPVLRGTTPAKQPMLPSPPKAIYNDRFWNNTYNNQQQQQQHPQQQQQPPQNTFQFLDQTTQRIECAENGKSYLQLGTMNATLPSSGGGGAGQQHPHHHHHLPVTPVIQPKPNMVYRRPIPPFRHMVSAASQQSSVTITTPRPVCDHSNCLQKKNSYCYQSQRSRMLSLSLSKLHMARQSHDGSLRRSVLICNMLRYIEDETDKEAVQEAANQFPNNSPMDQTAAAAQQETQQQQYWPPNSMNQVVVSTPPPPSSMAGPVGPPPSVGGGGSGGESGGAPIYPPMAPTGPANQQPPPIFSAPNSRELEPYENTLKDFNSAFRSTPYSSPAHPGSDLDSGISDEDRGINWSSVLSLSSQSELDPLNNNTFATEAWPNTANTPTTLSSMTDLSASVASVSSQPATPMDTNCSSIAVSSAAGTTAVNPHQGFDDIGWKLSADDVLKAFPNDENLFAVTGP